MSYRAHLQTVAGDTTYTIARWLMLVPLVAIVHTIEPVWPIGTGSAPLVFVAWTYAVVNLIISIVLLIPPLAVALRYAFVLDIVLLAAVAMLSGPHASTFFPLFFFPLLGAAVRFPPLVAFGTGLLAGFVLLGVAAATTPGGVLAALTLPLLLLALLLAFLPWLTASLVAHWSSTNRRHIEAAEQRRQQALDETQIYRERMHAFYTVSHTLSSTLDHKKVLETTLSETRKLVSFQVGMVLLSSGRPKELMVATVDPPTPADQGTRFMVGEGTIAGMLRSSSIPTLLEDISQEPELQSLTSLRACKAACLIPLRVKLNTYGILIIASEQPQAFQQEHLELLHSLANAVIVALHNAQLTFDLRQGNSKLLAKEKEVRDSIASRLHDGPTQKVAQIAMNTDFLKKVVENDPGSIIAELNKFGELARIANSEMRMTLFELRPLVLETEGLLAALKEYIEKLKVRSGDTKVALQTRGGLDTGLDKEAEGVLFNIIQESVNNALKHAQAQNIWIRLEMSSDTCQVSVQDNGKGFDLASARQSAAKRASFGLQNFGERAQMIGGTVEVDSEPGKGTTIKVIVPVDKG